MHLTRLLREDYSSEEMNRGTSFLLEKPTDEVMYVLLKSYVNFRIVPEGRLVEELRNKPKKFVQVS
jgi:hypothetical protein